MMNAQFIRNIFGYKEFCILKEGLCLCDRCCMGVGSMVCTNVDVCVVQVLKRCRAEAVHVLRLCCAELDAITGRAELELGSYG